MVSPYGKLSIYNGIIIRSRIPIDQRFLNKASNIKFIARIGSGTENIDLDFAKSKNIIINERKISPKELSNFKGCFITGTAAEITPVGNILVNNFEVCDLIKDLSASYETLVGKNN